MASSWSCPQARQWERMNGEPSARTRSMPGSRGQLSGPVSCQRASPFGGVAWPGTCILGFFFTSEQSSHHLGSFSGWGNLGANMLTLSPALPFPELRDGRSASPGYCLLQRLLTASLQPSSTPCLQGLFPNSCSNHTPRFREEPLLFLPPPSSGVGLKGQANLTAALLS